MGEKYGEYIDSKDAIVVKNPSVEVGDVNNVEYKSMVTEQEVTNVKSFVQISKSIEAKREIKKKETKDTIDSVITQLEKKGIDINKRRNEKSANFEKAMNGETLVDMFLVIYKDKLLSCVDINQIEEQFKIWNKERNQALPVLLSEENLKTISLWEQIRRGMASGISEEEMMKRTKTFLNRFNKGSNFKTDIESIFSQYSFGEIIGKVLETCDFRGKNNSGFRKLQYLAGCYTTEEQAFTVTWDGGWGDQTGSFLNDLRNSKEFMALPNSEKYLSIINNILATHGKIQYSKTLYAGYSKVTNERQKYLSDPFKYWKNQSVLSRHFDGIESESDVSSFKVDKVSQTETNFINSNRNGKLDGQLGDFLNLDGKSKEDEKIVLERLQSLLPKDILREHLHEFLKSEKVKKAFSKIFNLPASVLEDPILIEVIVNDSSGNEKFANVRKWIVSGMRKTARGKLESLSNNLQNHISEQCGISALGVKTKFLKGIFGKDSSIEPVERNVTLDPHDKNYPVYFKDTKCPSTIYEYHPNTGEIYAEDYYSSQGGILSFGKGNKRNEKPIYTMEFNYSDFIQNISVLDLLPKGRCENMESLEKLISQNIDSRMNYTAGYSATETLKQDNEVKRLKNGIVDTMVNLLGLKEFSGVDSGFELKKEDEPYYSLMLKVMNSIEGASRDELDTLNGFLSDLMNKLSNVDGMDTKKEPNPLIGFVFSKYKLLRPYGNDRIKTKDQSQEWRKKDFSLGVLMDALYNEDTGNVFEKIRILSEGISNSKYQDIYSLILTEYNNKEKDIEEAVVVGETRKEQARLAEDVKNERDLISRVDYA